MADRTSAEIFGNTFVMLSEMEQTPEVRKLVLYLWSEAGRYDFSDYQMECDKHLMKLGLAKRGIDPRWPEDGETVIYADRNGVLP